MALAAMQNESSTMSGILNMANNFTVTRKFIYLSVGLFGAWNLCIIYCSKIHNVKFLKLDLFLSSDDGPAGTYSAGPENKSYSEPLDPPDIISAHIFLRTETHHILECCGFAGSDVLMAL
jgi:hypothetical protein